MSVTIGSTTVASGGGAYGFINTYDYQQFYTGLPVTSGVYALAPPQDDLRAELVLLRLELEALRAGQRDAVAPPAVDRPRAIHLRDRDAEILDG